MSTDQTSGVASGNLRYRVISFGQKAEAEISEYDISEDELFESAENEVTRKRKRSHCHNHNHIKVMEDCFKISHHPSNERIQELAGEIGLHPLQVKSWFRYKRAQIKHDEENNNLPPPPSLGIKSQLLHSAFKEFITMINLRNPLWIAQPNGEREMLLNQQEYSRIFQIDLFAQLRAGYKYEASRDSAIVMMEASKVADIFYDPVKWNTVFSSMVVAGKVLEFIHADTVVGKPTIQKMSVKYKVVCPIVPSRNYIFIRWIRKRDDEQTWLVLDVSFDFLCPNRLENICFKRPSGCLIQSLPNNHSKITWIEHVEVKDDTLGYNLSSEYAFGAKTWLSILKRYCERNASVIGLTNYPYYAHLEGIGLPSPIGRTNILNLADKMVKMFCGGSISSPFYNGHPWKTRSGRNEFGIIHVKTRKCEEYPQYNGIDVLCASICYWIPVLPKIVFNFLHNSSTIAELNELIYGKNIKEIITIKNGEEAGNYVSVLQAEIEERKNVFLKESSTEGTSSVIVNAWIKENDIRELCKGENVNHLPPPPPLPLLPFGFTILPAGPPTPAAGGDSEATVHGTLLTAAFQFFMNSSLESSPERMTGIIRNILNTIKHDLENGGGT